ncbi:tetratricopeptide repeat protein [Pseudofulvibacter geojedonensis]|uniref:Tetratricopeptide repeat protein n=1 Tax=Pseudofulvibacter geojedonensis TaxID=1123758 RepID=A0ABW3HZW3_9FLAO
MRPKYINLLLLFLILFIYKVYSQKATLDSLRYNYTVSNNSNKRVRSLLDIANYYKPISLDSVIFYSKEIKKNNKLEESNPLNIERLLLEGHIAARTNNDSLFFNIIDKALELAIKNNEIILEGRSYYEKATFYYEKSNFSKVLEFSLKAENTFNKTDSIFLIKIRNLDHIAFFNLEFENYEKTLEYLNKVIELTKNSNFPKSEAHAYSSLACVYSEMGNHNKALKYINIAKEKFKQIADENGNSMVIHNTGILYFNKGEYNKAKNIFEKTINTPLSKRTGNNIEGYLYLAKIALHNKDYEIALNKLNYAEEASNNILRKDLYPKILIEKAKVYHSNGSPKEALRILNKVIKLPHKNYFKEDLRNAYLLKSNIYNSLENDKEELLAYKSYVNLKDEYQRKNNFYNIEFLKFTFEQELSNKEIAEQKRIIKSLEEKDKIKTKNNLILIIGTLIIIIFSIISFFRYKKINRLNKKRWDAERKVTELEQEQLIIEQKQLELNANARKKQLTDFAIHIAEKNELLEKIKDQIVNANLDGNNASIRSLLLFINEDIKKNKEKSQLYTNVEKNNDAFYNNLSINYPDLTEKEKKIASLIRLGYSSKQISDQLNVAKVSVNNYRSMLRKKLNLDRTQNLVEFIKNI